MATERTRRVPSRMLRVLLEDLLDAVRAEWRAGDDHGGPNPHDLKVRVRIAGRRWAAEDARCAARSGPCRDCGKDRDDGTLTRCLECAAEHLHEQRARRA